MKTFLKNSTIFFKGRGIFENFVFELPQINKGCFEYQCMYENVILHLKHCNKANVRLLFQLSINNILSH